MNHIYKVIWNKARNAYIVVSEFAKGYARNTTRSHVTRSAAILRLAVLLACTTSFIAVGAPLWVQATATVDAGTTSNGDTNTLAVGNGSSANGKGALAVGGGSQASGDTAVALAWGSQALSDYAIAIGHSAHVGGSYTYVQDGSTSGIRGTAQNAIAIGHTAVANGKDDVVIGTNNTAETPTASYVETNKTGAYAQGGRVIVGHDNSINGRSGNSTAIGSANTINAVHGIALGQNVQVGQKAGATGTKADKTSVTLEYENSMGIGVNAKSLSSNSIALGNGAVAGNERTTDIDTDWNGKGAIAIGETAQATGYYSLGLGAESKSTGDRTVALGHGTQALAQLATALGSEATASGARSTVVGEEASATATRAIAVGAKAKAAGRFAVAIGEEADGSGENGTAVGPEAKAQGKNSVAAGYQAKALSEGEIAIGTSAGNGDNRSNVNNAVSIGTSAHAREAGGVALGNAALANLGKSVAIGDSAKASNADSIAIGSGATASGGAGSIAIGSHSSVGRASGAAGGPRWSTSNDIGGRWYTWTGAKNATQGTDGTWTTTIDPKSTVWQSNLGAVSIGTDGLSGTTYTRQLTGLAAGTQDTDAVNVAQWKNTMLATIGDAKEDSTNTRYGSDGVARNVTRLVDEYLTLTGAADDGTTLTKDQLTTDANIGTMVGDNKITFRLAKDLKGLDSVTTGNTKMESSGLTITNTDSKKTITLDGTNGRATIGGVTVGYVNDGDLETNAHGNVPGGTFVYNLSNTTWDPSTYVSGRAATEDQLHMLGTAVTSDINNIQAVLGDGSFGLTADDHASTSTNLGSTIAVKGDGTNITTKVDDVALQITLNKNINLGTDGSVIAGNTTINSQGMTTNQVNVGDITLTPNGINGGQKQITNIASGGDTETNGANIGDVTRISQKNIQVKGGSNITVTDSTANGVRTSSVALNNNVDLSDSGSLAFGSTTDNTYVDKSGVITHVTNTDGTKMDATLSGAGLHITGKAADGTVSNQVVTDESGMVVGYETGDKANTLFDNEVGSGKQKTSVSTKGVKVEGTTNLDTNGQASTTIRKINTTLSEEGVNINQSQTLLQERGLTVGKDAEKTTAGQATVYRTGLNVTGSAVNDTAGKTATVTANGLTANGDTTGDKIATVTSEGMTVQADKNQKKTATYDVSGVALKDTDSSKTNTVSVDGMNIQNGTSGAALTTTNLQLGMTNGAGGINLGHQAGGGANTAEGNYLTGLSNTQWDEKNIASGRAATEDQLKAVADAIGTNVSGKTFGLADDAKATVSKTLGNTIQVKGDGKAISTTVDGDALKISLNDNITIGGKDGADGKDGHMGINGADGKSGVAIDGKDGISIKGKDGKDGVTLKGIDGKDGVNGAEGHIGLNGKDGITDIWTTVGTPGLNGKDGERMTRIVYKNTDGNTHEAATLDDGLKFGGDFGTASAVKLNKQVNVKGNAKNEDDLTDGNIGVVSSQDSDNGQLLIKLNKDLNLGGNGSVQMGNTTINNGGVTITNPTDNKKNVSLTDQGLNNGGNKITNVANGDVSANSTDAVNGSQLNEVKQTIENIDKHHTEVKANGEAAPAAEGTYTEGNLQIAQTTADDGHKIYDLKLSDTLNIGGAGKAGAPGKDGHMGINGADGKSGVAIDGKDGISIKGKDGKDGVTLKGIDGKDGVNGAEGHIGLNGKDGITDIWTTVGTPGLNGKDGERMTRIVYKNTDGNTHEAATLDDGLKFGGDFGTASAVKLNKQVNVKGNAKNEDDLTDGNIGVVSSQDSDNGQLLIKLNKDLNLTDKGSVTIGGITLKQGAVSMGGNQMANVASGTTGKTWDATTQGYDANWNNAANVGDVKKAIDDIKGKDNGGFGLTADDGQSVKQDLGKTITVAGDGKNIETKVADGKLQIGLKKDVDLGPDGSIKTGDTTINKDGVETNKITIKDSSISIDKDGIHAGNTVIKNVASGIVNNNDTDNSNAANIGDVKKIASDAADSVKAKSGKNITVNNDNTVNLNDHITMGDQNDASHKVDIDGTKGTITAGDKVSLDGSKGTGTIGGVTIGSQTAKTNLEGDKAKTESGNFVTGLDNKTWNPSENGIVSGRAATEGQLKVVDDKLTKGRVFQGDDGESNKVTVGLGDTLKLAGGANALNLSDGNIGVVKNSAGDGLDVKLSKNISGLDSVTTGNTVINNSGLTVKTSDSSRTITVQDGNVNMGKNVVTGVADGKIAPGSTDAVNGGQLAQRDEVIDNIGGEINKLGNRVNHVGAGAAALAALHPLDFDPDDKWDFAAGYGNYRGANAAALGAYYRPNEDTMLSVGGSFGGGENMVNAGVSFKLGQGNHVSTSRVAMAKEIKDLRKEIEGLRSALADVAAGNRLDPTKTKLFPDIPQNHWAYNEIAQLYGNGIVKGYPDGNFGGDRMMTRYEFAMMVYRQMQRGAALSDRIVNEFEPELERIRVDTITKDKDGNPVIQRVRVIKDRG